LLDLEAIRNEEKTRAMIDHLRQIKDDIDDMSKEIAESVMMISRYTFSIIDESIKELTAMRTEMEKKVNLSFNRTKTVISRYGESMQVLINHLEKTMQKASSMNRLSKYMLVKELTTEEELIEQLVSKFNENKQLMEQWS
jgi:methyl-accepting chemotaxis protein